MYCKRLLYSAIILGTVSTSVVSGGVALADTQNPNTPTVSQKEAKQKLGSVSKDPQQTQSSEEATGSVSSSTKQNEPQAPVESSTEASQVKQPQALKRATSAPAVKQQVAATQQSASAAATPKANAAVTDGWTKTEDATTITLTDYTGTTKDVVVPTNTDFNEPNKQVHITKPAMTAAASAANARYGTLVVSSGQNGKQVVADGADWSDTFAKLGSLTKIDLKNFETSNVTDMRSMFDGCSGLTKIDFGNNFDTSKVTGTKTLGVTFGGMMSMFDGCSSLTSLDLSNFKTESVTGMNSMFSGCSSLTSLNLSNFKTKSVTSMENMFLGCSSLKNIDFGNNFDTSNVTGSKILGIPSGGMRNMFSGCSSLTSLDLSSFITSKVKYMDNMFEDCSNLQTINLNNFDTSQVINLNTSKLFHVQNTKSLTVRTTDNGLKAYDYKSDNIDPITIDQTAVDAKNSSIYVGEQWAAKDNFVSATDKDGNKITDVSKVFVKGSVDTTKAGPNQVTYEYAGVKKTITVTVKANQAAVDAKDSTLYVGDSWAAKDNFVSATDKDGNKITDVSKVSVKGSVDTTKAGPNQVTYEYAGVKKTITVTVKDDTALTVHNSTLTQGDKWDPTSNITKALDKYGKDAKKSVTHDVDVDTNKVGATEVTYSLAKADGTKINAKATITVRAKITNYQVKFVAGQGGTLSGKTNQQIAKGAKVTSVPTAKANSGYKFDGWYNGTKKVTPTAVTINAATTFTARFSKVAVPVQTETMYRLYNPNSGEHFYTANTKEVAKVKKAGWRYEGPAWTAPVKGTPGAVPVYRLYNPNAGDHHYTLDVKERNHLIKVGWKSEDIGWYSVGKVPVYRQYNPNAKAGAHNFTTNKNEVKNLVKHGWRDEGKAWDSE